MPSTTEVGELILLVLFGGGWLALAVWSAVVCTYAVALLIEQPVLWGLRRIHRRLHEEELD